MTTPDANQTPYGSYPPPVDASAPSGAGQPAADQWAAGNYPPPAPSAFPPVTGYPAQPDYPQAAFPQNAYPPASYPQQPGGYPVPAYGAPFAGQPVAPRNGMGTAALVLGIVGILTTVFFFGTILDILAIIFGAVGLSRVKQGTANNRGKAMTGLILGVVALLGYLALIIFVIATRGTYSFNVST